MFVSPCYVSPPEIACFTLLFFSGNPTEVYYFGAQVVTTLLGVIPGAVLVHQVFLPIFYNLQIVSLNEVSESTQKCLPRLREFLS